jgi:hypothetical protein
MEACARAADAAAAHQNAVATTDPNLTDPNLHRPDAEWITR